MMVQSRAVILSAAWGAATAIQAAEAQAPSRIDSAGVAIVTNPLPRTEGRVLQLGRAPTIQIGDADRRGYAFDGVVSAFRLSSGQYAVGDRGSGEIRVFSSRGMLERVLGRRGNGPGEFSGLAHVWQTAGDSIRGWDGRLTTFALGSSEVHTLAVRGEAGDPRPRLGLVKGELTGGSLLAFQRRFTRVPRVESVTRDTLVVWLVSRAGILVAPVTAVLGAEVLKGAGGSMLGPSGTEQAAFSMRAMPFGLDTYMAATGEGLFSTESSGAVEWHVRSLDGRLLRIVRVRRDRTRVTPELIKRAEQSRASESVGSVSISSLPVARNLSPSQYPRFIPAYSGLRLDSTGRVWLRQMAAKGAEPERWEVFSADGDLIDILTLPDRFTMLDAGDDYLLGVWRDELDVEYVQSYQLTRARR